jgi:LPS-assembly protein
LNDPFLSYMDATMGYRGSLGAYLGVSALIPVADGLKLGGGTTYYSKRGVLVGPAGKYDANMGGQEIWGNFDAGYIHDTGDRLQDVLSRPVRKDRGYVHWEHHQNVRENLSINGNIDYWSDSEVVRDFVQERFVGIQTPDSFLEGQYTQNNYIVSLFTRFQPNDYIRVQQRLPELRFDLLPTSIGHGVYERSSASIAILREEDVSIYPERKSDRFDFYYGLERPITPTDWLTFTPVAGGRITHYARAENGKDNYTRVLGELGFDAALRTSGVFEYKNARWGIDGIRHLMTPRVSYRYIPDAEKGRRYIPQIDRTVFTTYLQPLGLGDQRNIDELTGTNTLRLGLDNMFQTRNPKYGSRDLLMFNIAADLRADRQPGQKTWSEVHTEAIFTPAHWLQVDVYESFSPYSMRIRQLNTGIRIVDGDLWSVRLGNRYLKGDTQEYILDGHYRLNEVYHPFARFHYDVRQSRFVEQTVGFRQVINNLWSIDYTVSFYSGRRRESNFGFSVRVNLMTF